MLLLWLITLLNGVANNKVFLEYRINLGTIPINLFDLLMGIGFVFAVFNPASRRHPIDRTHPAFTATITFLILGAIAGFAGTFTNGTYMYEFLNVGRNYLAIPMAITMGYLLLPNTRSAKRFLWANIFAGLLTALMIVLFFKGTIGSTKSMVNVNMMRTVNYISGYAGIGALFVFGCVVVGVRLMPLFVAIILGLFMIMGQFATLSRSDWVSTVAALCCTVFLVKWTRRGHRVAIAVVLVPVVLASLYGGVQFVSYVGKWDFGKKINEKLISMIPDDSNKVKAWDSRAPAAWREIEIFASNPLMGGGFGAQIPEERARISLINGFFHNAWTATAAGTGIFGFLGMFMVAATCIVIGRRMAIDRFDDATMLFGVYAFLSGVFWLIYGATTLSWNTLRGGIPFALTCGMVLRVRAVQLTQMRMQAELEEYYAQNPEFLYQASEEAYATNVQEPVYGNWYGAN